MESVDIALYVGYGLIIVAAAAAIILPLVNSLDNPKVLVKSGIGLLVLLVVFLVGYAISGNEVLPQYEEFGVDTGMSKFVGGALIMMYLMIGIALGGIVYSEISKIVK